jgi:hypothetical protein
VCSGGKLISVQTSRPHHGENDYAALAMSGTVKDGATRFPATLLRAAGAPHPGGWRELFLISTVPTLVLTLAQAAVATFLLKIRSWDLVILLRWVLAADIVVVLASTVIDVKFFPDNLPLDFITLVPSIIWLAYFFRSTRVQRVFKTHDWSPAPAVLSIAGGTNP